MKENHYILIATEDSSATFVEVGDELKYFEIFQMNDKVSEISDYDNMIVEAINQQEALKKYRFFHPHLMKKSTKNYYEQALRF